MSGFEGFVFRHGAIADDEWIQQRAFQEVLATYGVALSPAEYRTFFAGISDSAGFVNYSRVHPRLADHIEELTTLKIHAYAGFASNSLIAYEGVVDLILGLRSRSTTVGLITGSTRGELITILDALGLADAFDATVTSDETGNANPYAVIDAQLSLRGKRRICFEHSPVGTRQARAAGYHCVAVTGMHEPNEFDDPSEVVPTIFEWMTRNDLP